MRTGILCFGYKSFLRYVIPQCRVSIALGTGLRDLRPKPGASAGSTD